MSCAKTAELIEMLFGMWTQMGPRNRVLVEGPDPQGKEQFFLGGGASCSPAFRQNSVTLVPYC